MLAPRGEVIHTDKYTGNQYRFRRSALSEQNRRAPTYQGGPNPHLQIMGGGPMAALRNKNVGNNDSHRSFGRIATEPNAQDMTTIIQTKVKDNAHLRIIEGQLTTQRASGQVSLGKQTRAGGPTGASGYGQTTLRVIPHMEWVNGVLVFRGHHHAPDLRPDGNQVLIRGAYEPSRQNRNTEYTFSPTPAGLEGGFPSLPPVTGAIHLTEGLRVHNMGSAAELLLNEPVPKLFASNGPKHKMTIDGVETLRIPLLPGTPGEIQTPLRDDSSGLPMIRAPIRSGAQDMTAGIGALELAEDSWANRFPQPDQVAALVPGETPMITLSDGELMHLENPANRPEFMKVAGPGGVKDPLRNDARLADMADPMYDVPQPNRFDTHHQPTGHNPLDPFPRYHTQALHAVNAETAAIEPANTNRGMDYSGPIGIGVHGPNPTSMRGRAHAETGSNAFQNIRQKATAAVRAAPARIELHRGDHDSQMNRRLGAQSGAGVNPMARRQVMGFSDRRDSTKMAPR